MPDCREENAGQTEENRALYTRMGTARDTVPLLAHLGRSARQ